MLHHSGLNLQNERVSLYLPEPNSHSFLFFHRRVISLRCSIRYVTHTYLDLGHFALDVLVHAHSEDTVSM